MATMDEVDAAVSSARVGSSDEKSAVYLMKCAIFNFRLYGVMKTIGQVFTYYNLE